MKLRNKIATSISFILLILGIVHAFQYKHNPSLYSQGTIFNLKMLFFTLAIIMILSTLIISVLYIQRQDYLKFKTTTFVASYCIVLLAINALIDHFTLLSLI